MNFLCIFFKILLFESLFKIVFNCFKVSLQNKLFIKQTQCPISQHQTKGNMQILARQNPFEFQGPPSSNRQNRFFQRPKSPRRRSKGISSVRALSVNFDQLYNPYRLRELGSSEKYSSTTYKSVSSRRQLTKSQLNELKIVQIGKGLLINEIPSAENTESIVSTYWKLEQILRENFLNKDQKLCPVCTGQGSLMGEQFKDSMFGNIEKITSGHPSFLSFPSNEQTHTVFYSILSNSEL